MKIDAMGQLAFWELAKNSKDKNQGH